MGTSIYSFLNTKKQLDLTDKKIKGLSAREVLYSDTTVGVVHISYGYLDLYEADAKKMNSSIKLSNIITSIPELEDITTLGEDIVSGSYSLSGDEPRIVSNLEATEIKGVGSLTVNDRELNCTNLNIESFTGVLSSIEIQNKKLGRDKFNPNFKRNNEEVNSIGYFELYNDTICLYNETDLDLSEMAPADRADGKSDYTNFGFDLNPEYSIEYYECEENSAKIITDVTNKVYKVYIPLIIENEITEEA